MVSRITKFSEAASAWLKELPVIGRLARDRRGVAAVEFALILPIIAMMAFGTVEVTDGWAIKRKLTHITSTLGDLVTQSKIITDADMKNILDASSAIIVPYDSSLLKIVVSGITIDTNAKATVKWSDARNATPLTKGATYTGLPATLQTASTFLVVAQITYNYKPSVFYVLTAAINFSDQFYLRPRLSQTICRNTNPCT